MGSVRMTSWGEFQVERNINAAITAPAIGTCLLPKTQMVDICMSCRNTRIAHTPRVRR
jgi:hypothetical protein